MFEIKCILISTSSLMPRYDINYLINLIILTMPVVSVLLLGNPILREISSPIYNFDQKENQMIVTDLADTLSYLQKQEGLGRGLAAPQIGYLKQIVAYNTPGAPEVMFNPKIHELSTEKFQVWDSCFCFNLDFFIKVERFRKIKIEYQDVNGNHESLIVENELAELFQHEVDHLNGILAIDHLISTQNICMREEWEKQYN